MASPAAIALLKAQGVVTTASGRRTTIADLSSGREPAPSFSGTGFPQVDRWPLPGSGVLHPLDCVRIAGVTLPLAKPPDFVPDELDVSERREQGADYASYVSHGKKNSPVRLTLRLFRDLTLGWENGAPRGKDWWAEWAKIDTKLVAKNLDKRGAVPVSHPLLARYGIVSLLVLKIGPPTREKGQFWTIEIEGRDPRTMRRGGSHKVKQLQDFGSRANPIPPQKNSADKAPSASKKGK